MRLHLLLRNIVVLRLEAARVNSNVSNEEIADCVRHSGVGEEQIADVVVGVNSVTFTVSNMINPTNDQVRQTYHMGIEYETRLDTSGVFWNTLRAMVHIKELDASFSLSLYHSDGYIKTDRCVVEVPLSYLSKDGLNFSDT